MGAKESKEVAESHEPSSVPVEEGGANDVVEDKNVLPLTEDNKLPHSNSPPGVASKVQDSAAAKKISGGSIDRDARLARVATDKKMSLIKAWEESEKTKADNKSYKKMSGIGSWENTKKASLEAQLRKIEEKLEKKKARYAENMQNKMAKFHKAAEEKKAIVEAKHGKDFLKVEEEAAKYRATGHAPKKFLGCF